MAWFCFSRFSLLMLLSLLGECKYIYIYINTHTHTQIPFSSSMKLVLAVKYRNLITVYWMKLIGSSFKYRLLKSLCLEKVRELIRSLICLLLLLISFSAFVTKTIDFFCDIKKRDKRVRVIWFHNFLLS